MHQDSLRHVIVEELDQNLRLLTAISAFRFRDEVLPDERIRMLKLHHYYLLRLLHRCDNPVCPTEYRELSAAMDRMAQVVQQERAQLLQCLPERQKVITLMSDTAWDHRSLPIKRSFAPDDVLERERLRRDKIDSRRIHADASLRSILDELPPHWLRVIAANLGLRTPRRTIRARHIEAIIRYLADPAHVQHVVSTTSDAEQSLLRVVLEAGGSLPFVRLREIFGDDFIDGYYWDIHPPRTTVGRLRSRALVTLGSPASDGLVHIIVPLELRSMIEMTTLSDTVVVFPERPSRLV